MNPVLRFGAYVLSVISHPLLMLMYGLLVLMVMNPYLFPSNDALQLGLVLRVFLYGVMFPTFSILLMLGIGLIQSIHMPNKTDRIGPLIVTCVVYLWLYLNIRTHSAVPIPFAVFVLGGLLSLFLAFFINNFSKISLHGVGMGGFLLFFLSSLVSEGTEYLNMTIGDLHLSVHSILFLCFLLSFIGMALSSRIYLKAHNNEDVIGGFLVGIIGQLLAMLFG